MVQVVQVIQVDQVIYIVNLIDVTLACEYSNSKLVEVVTVTDVIDEDGVGNSLVQI